MTRVRVACCGAGYFSQFHYDSWGRMDDVTGVGACDRQRDLASATGWPAFDDLRTMLAQTQPDLLDLILPPPAQAAAIRTALAAGVKWIICQKPFCTSLDEARRITDAAETAGATLIIHENFRFQPWFRAIKSAIDAGQVGQVLRATFRLRPGDGQGPDAYRDRQPYFRQMPRLLIHETGVHYIDTFRYLLGGPLAVYADLQQVNPVLQGEDAGIVIFDHPHGARAILDGNRNLDHAADNLRRTMGEALIEGTAGTLTLTGDGAVHLRGFHQQDAACILPPDRWPGFGGDCVHALQSHVISALLSGTRVENTARDYLPVIAIKEAIYASDATGQKTKLNAP